MYRYLRLIVIWVLTVVFFGITMASVSAATEKWNQATLKWRVVDGAASYNIYFKETGQTWFTHALTVPGDATSYTITYLKKGRGYHYSIMAVNGEGREFMTTGIKRMSPVSMR